jgi:pimeloyl-ACP methyl ester carboxylesterase
VLTSLKELEKLAERISNPTEQRLILKDGRTLGFAEYGDPKGEPMLEFHGCPSSRLEARNYDEAGKKLITMQVNIWHGEFGYMVFPAGAKYVASKLPNHKLHIVPNAGHISLVVERAEDVLRELLAGN